MTDIVISRHQTIFNPLDFSNIPICIVGAGATGSRVAMALIELGITNITIFDFDVVEPHNLANQAFLHNHVGMYKVNAIGDLYLKKTGATQLPEDLHLINAKVPCEGHELKGIVFLLTDTMSSRKEIFETCLKNNPNVLAVIETRMASSYGNIYSFDPNSYTQSNKWVNSLIDDDKAEVSACGTSISVGVTASLLASLAVWEMIHILKDDGSTNQVLNFFLKPTVFHTGSL